MSAYDVVVLGGGPAGCATALALHERGVHVAVVESSTGARSGVGESAPPELRHLLQRLGLADAFLEQQHEPCLGSCSVWGQSRAGFNDFLLNPHGTGWHLDRGRFDEWLRQHTCERGVEVMRGGRFAGVSAHGRGAQAVLFEGRGSPITSRVVVDATGRSAKLSRARGASRRVHDRMTYVTGVFHVGCDSPFSRMTMLEAVEYGWWYGARVPGGQVVVGLTTSTRLLRSMRLHRVDTWWRRLQRTDLLGPALVRATFDANTLRVCTVDCFALDGFAGEGWIAVGDAAASYDPLTARGIYKALDDGIHAADAIVDMLAGRSSVAQQYAARVRSDYAMYRQQRDLFYAGERRWSDAVFWRERTAGVS